MAVAVGGYHHREALELLKRFTGNNIDRRTVLKGMQLSTIS
jgi:hypothetical protein